jgi:ribokinase
VSVDVVDTTGAGDAFNSGLAMALAEGKTLNEAAKYASCAGAIACTKLGVIPALGTREMVDQLYTKTFT